MRKILWFVLVILSGCRQAPVEHRLTIWYSDGPTFASYEIKSYY